MVRRIVTIDSLERFHRHAEELGGLPHVDTCLQQPGGRGVAQHMGGDFGTEAGGRPGSPQGIADRGDRPAVPFDHEVARDPEAVPAAQMREQARRDWHWRLPLAGLCSARRLAPVDAGLEVDVTGSIGHARPHGSAADGGRAGAGVQRDQNEAGNVAAGGAASAYALPYLPHAPCGEQQLGRLAASEKAHAGLWARRQGNGRNVDGVAFPAPVVERGAQILELAPGAVDAGAALPVGAAAGALDGGYELGAEVCQQVLAAGGRVGRAGMGGRYVGEVEIQDIGNKRRLRIGWRLRAVAFEDVAGEDCFSRSTVFLAAASANKAGSIADEPLR